jgi:hypothetical protein
MQCRFPVQLLSVISAILVVIPPLCYCSNTFKFNVSMITGIAMFWSALAVSTLITYHLFQDDVRVLPTIDR